MFLLWTSDLSPCSSHSPSSRFPICIIPASLYVFDHEINITLNAVTQAITTSFNHLSNVGINLHNLPSLGGDIVPLTKTKLIMFSILALKLLVGVPNLIDGTCHVEKSRVSTNQLPYTFEVGTLRLWVLGFRGDWKAVVAIFNLIRHYNVNEAWFATQTFCGRNFKLNNNISKKTIYIYLHLHIYIHIPYIRSFWTNRLFSNENWGCQPKVYLVNI